MLRDVIPRDMCGFTTSFFIEADYPPITQELKAAIKFHLNGLVNSAREVYEKLVKDESSDPRVYSNLAAIEYTKKNYSQVRKLLLQSHKLRSRPGHDAYLISIMSLLLGDYPTAWAFYEYRWLNSYIPQVNLEIPVFDETKQVYGSHVLLHQDGGLGDHVFVLQLYKSSQVPLSGTFMGDQKSSELIQSLNPDIRLFQRQEGDLNGVKFNCWLPFQSLTRINKTLDTAVMQDSEMPPPRKMREWQGKPKLGIHWQGNSMNELYLIPGSRSISLSAYEEIIRSERYNIYPLQVGQGAEELKQYDEHHFFWMEAGRNVTPSIRTLVRSLKKLDVVLCTDSLIANLAGFLNIPTLLIVSEHHDWRWHRRSKHCYSYWYPSICIYQWIDILDQRHLMEALSDFVKSLR
jgi:hypothetical protein